MCYEFTVIADRLNCCVFSFYGIPMYGDINSTFKLGIFSNVMIFKSLPQQKLFNFIFMNHTLLQQGVSATTSITRLHIGHSNTSLEICDCKVSILYVKRVAQNEFHTQEKLTRRCLLTEVFLTQSSLFILF